MKKFLYLGAALAALALCGPASAAGYYTNGLPTISTANIQGTELIPTDTNYAGGASPQTAAVTLNQVSAGAPSATGTAVSGAVTVNSAKVIVTSESLTTANSSAYTLTLTDSSITAASNLQVTIGNGTNTTAGSTLATATPAAGSATIVIYNRSGSAALNGTLVVFVRVL